MANWWAGWWGKGLYWSWAGMGKLRTAAEPQSILYHHLLCWLGKPQTALDHFKNWQRLLRSLSLWSSLGFAWDSGSKCLKTHGCSGLTPDLLDQNSRGGPCHRQVSLLVRLSWEPLSPNPTSSYLRCSAMRYHTACDRTWTHTATGYAAWLITVFPYILRVPGCLPWFSELSSLLVYIT